MEAIDKRREREEYLDRRTAEAHEEWLRVLDLLTPMMRKELLETINRANRIAIKGRANGDF